jgi:hypothetical protein
MATINSLSSGLLEQIFDYVARDSDKFKYSKLSSMSEIFDTRSPTRALLLVNKAFYWTARRLQNRHKHLIIRQEAGDEDTQKTIQLISALLNVPSQADVLGSIRALTITCGLWRPARGVDATEIHADPKYEHNIDQVASLIAKIPRLDTLNFKGNVPFPLSLLRALEKHQPKCNLHIHDWYRPRADTDHKDPGEIALAHSPNLRSIVAEVCGDGNTRLDLRMFALKRIVALSPHLESVEIRQGSFGCFIRSYGPQEKAEMEQLGAPFTAERPSPNNIKRLKSRGGDHVKMLEEVTDLSTLESLDLGWSPNFDFFSSGSRKHVFQSSGPRFESLKHLSVEMSSWYDPRIFLPETYLQKFLAVCPPLQSLKINDRRGRFNLSIILDNHGQSLRSLHLHESERKEADEAPDCNFLTLDNIREIGNRCPNLEEFSADIEHGLYPESKKEILEELARFEKLRKLTLYFSLYLLEMASSPDPPKAPLLLEFRGPISSDGLTADLDPFNHRHCPAWLENIYSFLLHQRRVNHLQPFDELYIKLGEWERQPPMGLPANWECLEGRHKRCFVLTSSESDGGSEQVEVRTLRLDNLFEEKSVKEEREMRKVVERERMKGW